MTAEQAELEPEKKEERQSPQLASEDELRVNLYRLVARFLSSAPSEKELAIASELKGDDTPLGTALRTFALLAGRARVEDVEEEYHNLFIGLARGELLPVASYYLTGFLHEKPLAKLRNDMSKLGIERNPENKDPEDHIAALMDMMAGLISGDFGEPAPVGEQKRFFETHLGPWADYFFADMEAAKSSVLYAALGSIGRRFMEIEEAAFAMGE